MIFLITNRNLVSEERYIQVIKEASLNGVERIILREKDLNSEKLEVLYNRISSNIKNNTKIIINSNIKCAEKVNAYGIHLTFKDFMAYENTKGWVVGVSIHSIEEGIKAWESGASYLLASNIYETKCKEGLKGKGVAFIKELKAQVDIPVIALGGINPKNKDEVLKAGADGIAVMSGIMESDNVGESIRELRAFNRFNWRKYDFRYD